VTDDAKPLADERAARADPLPLNWPGGSGHRGEATAQSALAPDLTAPSPLVDPLARLSPAERLPFALTVAGSLLFHGLAVVVLIIGLSIFQWRLFEPPESIPVDIVIETPPEPVPVARAVDATEVPAEPTADVLAERAPDEASQATDELHPIDPLAIAPDAEPAAQAVEPIAVKPDVVETAAEVPDQAATPAPTNDPATTADDPASFADAEQAIAGMARIVFGVDDIIAASTAESEPADAIPAQEPTVAVEQASAAEANGAVAVEAAAEPLPISSDDAALRNEVETNAATLEPDDAAAQPIVTRPGELAVTVDGDSGATATEAGVRVASLAAEAAVTALDDLQPDRSKQAASTATTVEDEAEEVEGVNALMPVLDEASGVELILKGALLPMMPNKGFRD
jgi:hypothetical protein